MPRAKAHRCHTCGLMYVTARCPKCYPARGKRRGGRGRAVGRRGRVSVGLSWGGGWPIAGNAEAVADHDPAARPSTTAAGAASAQDASRMQNKNVE